MPLFFWTLFRLSRKDAVARRIWVNPEIDLAAFVKGRHRFTGDFDWRYYQIPANKSECDPRGGDSLILSY